MSEPFITIMLADDHYVVRMGLASVLQYERSIQIVAAAQNGKEAIELYRLHRADVTLMDLRMPDMDGIEAARQILREFPAARILILSTFDSPEEVRRALEAGTAGYILKTAGQEELISAIKTVARGSRFIPASFSQHEAASSAEPALSARQIEVLELLAKGLSRKEIAQVLGFTEDGAKAHLKSIFAKLGVNDRVEAVVTAIQNRLIRID